MFNSNIGDIVVVVREKTTCKGYVAQSNGKSKHNANGQFVLNPAFMPSLTHRQANFQLIMASWLSVFVYNSTRTPHAARRPSTKGKTRDRDCWLGPLLSYLCLCMYCTRYRLPTSNSTSIKAGLTLYQLDLPYFSFRRKFLFLLSFLFIICSLFYDQHGENRVKASWLTALSPSANYLCKENIFFSVKL